MPCEGVVWRWGIVVLSVVLCLNRIGAAESKNADSAGLSLVQISSDRASLRLHLLIQGGLHVFPNQESGERSTFALERARIDLSGHLVSKNFTYRLTGDAAAFTQPLDPAVPGAEAAVLPGNEKVPFLLDALVRFDVPVVGLRFTFGRFIPSLGLMMAEEPENLGTVLYPLYIFGGKGAMGDFRDVGLEMEIRIGKAASLGGGVFNGGFNNWVDDNDTKDPIAFFTLRPNPAFMLRVSSMFKFTNVEDGTDELGHPLEKGMETHITPCAEARYEDHGLDVIGGYGADFTLRDDRDTREDDRSQGAFGHVGYMVLSDLLELAVRLDWWDPSAYIEDNEQFRITAGPSLYFQTTRLALRVYYIQDIFTSEQAMCETYLHSSRCERARTDDARLKLASTLLFQVSLSL